MNRGLWIKGLRETWVTTLLFGLGLGLFQALVVAVAPSFHEQMEAQFLELPFVKEMLQALLGAEVGAALGPMGVGAIAWVHPMALALVWAHAIVLGTRTPVGEIDRGTIDVWLALPVSRWQAYVTDTGVWASSAVVVVALGLLGNALGALAIDLRYDPGWARRGIVAVNLAVMHLSVGGLTSLFSARSERRGRAVGWLFGLILLSFLVHVLGQYWAPAKNAAFLALLHYYRPFEILQTGAWPWTDLAVLGGAGAAFWAWGGRIFARRDICTV